MAAFTTCSDFGAPKRKSLTVSTVSPSIWHEVMGLDAMILVFECWVLSQLFYFPLSLSSTGSLVPLHFLPLELYHHIIFIPEVLDISPSSLDFSVYFIQPSVSHDVLCVQVKQAGWQYTALTYCFSYLEPVCSMSSSNCCFLTCIQISQEAGQVVWYSHLLKNFPQFIVIHLG